MIGPARTFAPKVSPKPGPFPFTVECSDGQHEYHRPQAMLNFNPAPRFIRLATAYTADGKPVCFMSVLNPDHPDYAGSRAKDFPWFAVRNEVNHYRRRHLQILTPQVLAALKSALLTDVEHCNDWNTRLGRPLVQLDDDLMIREVPAEVGVITALPTASDCQRPGAATPVSSRRRGRRPKSAAAPTADFAARTAPPATDPATDTLAPKIALGSLPSGSRGHFLPEFELLPVSGLEVAPPRGLLRRLAARLGRALISYSTRVAG